MNWIKIYERQLLPDDDFVAGVSAEGKKLCIVKSDGKLYATQPYCPHAGAPLSFGKASNGKLICPYHRYEYDLLTGRGNPGQGDYISTYPVEIRDDGVFVGLPSKGNWFKLLFGS